MDLSKDERWALERLQKRQQRWRIGKWVSLAADVGLMASGFYLRVTYAKELLNLWKQKGYQAPINGFDLFIASEFSQLSLLGELLMLLGACALGLTIGFWRGRPSDILFGRLFRDASQGPAKEGAV